MMHMSNNRLLDSITTQSCLLHISPPPPIDVLVNDIAGVNRSEQCTHAKLV